MEICYQQVYRMNPVQGRKQPEKIAQLQQRYFAPLGARLARYPKGRKQ